MHKSNGGIIFWNQQRDRIIDLYIKQGFNCSQISKLYNCDSSTIGKYLKMWDIKKKRPNALYSLDVEFFDTIDCEAKAYFFGLLLSDGHISKTNGILLTMKDLDIIEKYKNALQSNAPIKKDRYGNYVFNITCKHMADALREKGLHNRKSYYIDFEKVINSIPDELRCHLIRGMFDGDGSIRIYHYSYFKNPSYHLGYTGTKEVVNYIHTYFGLHTKIVKESDYTYTCVTSCKQSIINIYYLLYNEATIYMERKYKTFLQII